MKKAVVVFLIGLIISCGGKTPEVFGTAGEAKIVAVWTNPDSSKAIDIMLRVINKNIKYDSAKKKDIIVIDTVWGKPVYFDALDGFGKTIIDSITGRPKQITRYVVVPKDSVNWRIEGVSVDSLLKKR